MKKNKNGGAGLRRREWLVAATAPAWLAACGGGDPAGPLSAPAVPAPMAAAVPMADLPPGELSLAFFAYLQLSVGGALNGLQALRLTGTVSGNGARAAMLDQLIASRAELLASLYGFTAAVRPVFSGAAASVVLAPASATTRAMVLDRTGLAAMDATIGSYLAALLAGTPQSAAAHRPMSTISMSGLATILRGQKSVIALDNAIGSRSLTPAQTALAVVGGVVAVAAIGVLLAGSAVPAAVAGGVWAASATVGTIVGGMALFTGVVNAAASTYGVFDAETPADRAAQWQGVLGGAKQVAQGLVDGVAAVAKPASLAGQALGFANNALKNWQMEQDNAPALGETLQQATGSGAPADKVTAVDVSAPGLPSEPGAPATASLGSDGTRVQAPLDANGDGRILVPADVAAAPGAMCVNDPLDGLLLAANDIAEAIVAGMKITVDAPACGFAGEYQGQFAGQDFGPVSATLTEAGGVAASGASQKFGHSIVATGSVGVSGTFLAIAGSTRDGATFSGKLRSGSTIGWAIAGAWSNAGSGLSGTFNLIRRSCS